MIHTSVAAGLLAAALLVLSSGAGLADDQTMTTIRNDLLQVTFHPDRGEFTAGPLAAPGLQVPARDPNCK